MSNTAANILKLISSIIACQFAGFIGSIFTAASIPMWYTSLNKPPFTPPNWLFAPAWIILYLLMAIAAFLIWQKGLNSKGVKKALILFLIQLVLNSLWSVIFFGLQSPLWGMILIVLLWIAIIFTMLKFYKISTAACWLLLPYILWITFAATLNFSIWILNL
ncbi:TspO/MBR family protein [Chloroflexota bacterium]